MGYKLGDKYVKLSQNPRNNFIKKTQDLLNNSLYLYALDLNNENFKIIVEKINSFKPFVIRGYPDIMLFLATYIKNNNIKIIRPKAVTTTGNILFPNTRLIIEEVFNCKVFDSYGCEGGAIMAECESHNSYHASMEYAITEVINNGREVNDGEKGRVITTDLQNFGQPFIRYDTQDYVVKSKTKCSCDRNLLSIDKIEGRDSDILISPEGKLLIVHIFTIYFEWIDSVEQFQVRQDRLDEFCILLKVNSKFSKREEERICSYWGNYIGGNVKIKINIVDDIPLTKSGKRRFLIRNQQIKINFQ